VTGRRLSHYQVAEKLGAGGMGEVFRAHDTRLNRDVAIKTLPAEFAHDPERLARFEREAQLLAALNHPNSTAIYGLEETDGGRFRNVSPGTYSSTTPTSRSRRKAR